MIGTSGGIGLGGTVGSGETFANSANCVPKDLNCKPILPPSGGGLPARGPRLFRTPKASQVSNYLISNNLATLAGQVLLFPLPIGYHQGVKRFQKSSSFSEKDVGPTPTALILLTLFIPLVVARRQKDLRTVHSIDGGLDGAIEGGKVFEAGLSRHNTRAARLETLRA